MNDNIHYYDSGTYISFVLIANMIFRHLHITDLYREIITSKVVRKFQLADNNAVSLPFKLTLLTSGVENAIYESDYLYIPDPYHTSKDERNKICVIDDVFGGIIYKTTQKYLTIGILIEENSDYIIYLLTTQVIDTVSLLVVDLKKWNLVVSILNSENELVEFINMYKETDRYEVCFLVNSMNDSNKTVFTTVYTPDYCKSNFISMDSYSFSSLFNIVQQFMVTYSGCRFAFYYKDEYQQHYKKLEEILATIEYTVLVSLPISSDPDVLKASYNEVGFSTFPVVVFVDVDNEDVDKIEDGVTKYFTHILFQIFFFQWFEENREYINRPYYYYYGSVYSLNSSSNVNTVFSSLYHNTNNFMLGKIH